MKVVTKLANYKKLSLYLYMNLRWVGKKPIIWVSVLEIGRIHLDHFEHAARAVQYRNPLRFNISADFKSAK